MKIFETVFKKEAFLGDIINPHNIDYVPRKRK